MVTILLIVIVAILLCGASAVLRFAQGFLIAAAVVAALIVAALFAKALFPFLVIIAGFCAIVGLGIGYSIVSKPTRTPPEYWNLEEDR